MAAPWVAPMPCTRWCRCLPASRWRRSPLAPGARRTLGTWRPGSWPSPMRRSPSGSTASGPSRRPGQRPASIHAQIRRARARGADDRPMIDRYALPEMRDVFSERRKLELWLRIELLATEALNAAGVVPDGDWERIKTGVGTGDGDPARAHGSERESQHAAIALLPS